MSTKPTIKIVQYVKPPEPCYSLTEKGHEYWDNVPNEIKYSDNRSESHAVLQAIVEGYLGGMLATEPIREIVEQVLAVLEWGDIIKQGECGKKE